MAVIVCIAGAAVGLIIAAVSNWLVLPMVLDRQLRVPRSACLHFWVMCGRSLSLSIVTLCRSSLPRLGASRLTTCSSQTRHDNIRSARRAAECPLLAQSRHP